MRFTRYQVILFAMFEKLIELYNRDYISTREKELDARMALFELRTYPDNIKSMSISDKWNPKITPRFPGVHSPNDTGLVVFRNMMESLRMAIAKGERKHFSLIRVEDSVITDLSLFPNSTETDVRTPEESSKNINWKTITSKIDKTASLAIQYHTETKDLGKLRISSATYRDLYIDYEPEPELALKILKSEPCEEPPNRILSIWSQSWTSLTQIVRSIIVNFYFAFNGFDRLKTCKYCQKLIIEKKANSRDFCGPECRKKFFTEGPGREEYLCRQRQNVWIKNHISRRKFKIKNIGEKNISDIFQVYTVQKDQCESCVHIEKSGECKELRKKNKTFFNQLENAKLKKS